LGKENYHEFGAFLGASYEGYEEEIISLLKAIDARRSQQTRDNGKIAKSGGKGSRELKSLISTVNYETGSSRRKVIPGIGCCLLSNEFKNSILECAWFE
jgi:hypothetical protein